MGSFSQVGGSSKEIEYGFDTVNVRGQAVTAGTANVKGSYVDVVSAVNNTHGGNYLRVYIDTERVGNAAEFLVDIALGPATETVIIDNLYLSRTAVTSAAAAMYVYDIPISIPTGVRVSASAIAYVYIKLLDKTLSGYGGLSSVTTYGAATANSSGTLVAHGSAGWGGSWVSITTSTTSAIRGFFVARNRTPLSWSNATLAFQLSIGGAGNEDAAIVYEADTAKTQTNEDIGGAVSPFINIPIPNGSRISIKTNASLNDGDLDFDFIFYGVS